MKIWKRVTNIFSRYQTQAARIEEDDFMLDQESGVRHFSRGTRPVIRWIKGNGLDDNITRAAIGQATRLFGDEADYCLCTQGLEASRVRAILEWADQPVEWWPVSEADNLDLANLLIEAGCSPENFGYWWKWFPERVRPDAPEWILDGDMVITGKPDWFSQWINGSDVVRLSQDDVLQPGIYGRYSVYVDSQLMFYSGLASLPPACRFMPSLLEVLTIQPLVPGQNGKRDMDEQGVIAATFQQLIALPIPLHEFPFCRAFQDYTDFGLKGDQGKAWGYHFGASFIMDNPHFHKLTKESVIFSMDYPSSPHKFKWLGNFGQWGIPGWSLSQFTAEAIIEASAGFIGKEILEIGTSRGHLSAMLADYGHKLTTLDHIDRGASKNLKGYTVNILKEEAVKYLRHTKKKYALIICDFHRNSRFDWQKRKRPLMKQLKMGSVILLYNFRLDQVPGWEEENGVEWFMNQLNRNHEIDIWEESLPGFILIKRLKKKRFSWNLSQTIIINRLKKLLSALDRKMILRSNLFDEAYYLETNPDVKMSGMPAITHFIQYGWKEGRNPSPGFNIDFYLKNNPDVAESGMNPLLHYYYYGRKEGRLPG